MWWEFLLNSHSKEFISIFWAFNVLYTWCLCWHVLVITKIRIVPCLTGVYTFFSELVMSLSLRYSFFSGERSEACLHKDRSKWFFFRPCHPCVFHLSNSFFLGTYWLHSTDFHINTTTGSRSTLFQIFGRQNYFWRVVCRKSSIFALFGRVKLYFRDPSS